MDEWRVAETDQSLRSAKRIMYLAFGIDTGLAIRRSPRTSAHMNANVRKRPFGRHPRTVNHQGLTPEQTCMNVCGRYNWTLLPPHGINCQISQKPLLDCRLP